MGLSKAALLAVCVALAAEQDAAAFQTIPVSKHCWPCGRYKTRSVGGGRSNGHSSVVRERRHGVQMGLLSGLLWRRAGGGQDIGGSVRSVASMTPWYSGQKKRRRTGTNNGKRSGVLRSQSHDHAHDHADPEPIGSGVATASRGATALGLDGAPAVSVPGHSHNHMGHSHSHAHIDLNALRSKRSLARVVLAAIIVVALPIYRRSSRREVAVVALVATFLGVIEAGKSLVASIRVNFSSLYLGWMSHSKLASAPEALYGSNPDAAREAEHVTWAGVWINLGLAISKMFAGVYGHSAAMIADAGHSLSDLLSDGVTLWAVKLSKLPPDEDHPYGHGRFEAVGACVISVMLLLAGFHIGNHAYEMLVPILASANVGPGAVAGALSGVGGDGGAVSGAVKGAVGGAVEAAAAAGHAHTHTLRPTRLAVLAAAVSIISKEGLYQVTERVGKRLNSQVLIANAWHHRSDAISSVVAILAIIGSMCGFPILDPLAGLFVAGMVSLTGLQVCWESLKQLTDTVDLQLPRDVARAFENVDGVLGYDRIRARQMGRETLVDLTIRTDKMISASAGQQIGQRVRWSILQKLPSVSDVLVNIAVDEKPCPAAVALPPQAEVESAIRETLSVFPDVREVTNIMVFYLDMNVSADVFIRVDPKLRVSEASAIAAKARTALGDVSNMGSARVHLDLEGAQ